MKYNYNERRFELINSIYELTEEENREVDDQYYYNCTCTDTLKWFRRVGGTEILRHSRGKHTLTSYSPSKQVKVIRTFTEIL